MIWYVAFATNGKQRVIGSQYGSDSNSNGSLLIFDIIFGPGGLWIIFDIIFGYGSGNGY